MCGERDRGREQDRVEENLAVGVKSLRKHAISANVAVTPMNCAAVREGGRGRKVEREERERGRGEGNLASKVP